MKKICCLLVLVMLAAMTGFACAEEAAVDYLKDIPYIDDGNEDHLLDIFGFDETVEKKPTIIEVHGGGFFGGTKETNTDHSRFYAEQGFAVVTPNYTHLPKGDFQTLMEEIFGVMHWMENNAEAYHLDLDNVFISGDSAGGFTVALTALLIGDENVRAQYGVTPPSFPLKAYVLTCPKVNVPGDREMLDTKNGPASFSANKIKPVLLDDEMMAKVDLLNLISDSYPYVYIMTTPDDAILYEEAILFDEFLTSKGIDHEFHVYEREENELMHVFNILKVDYIESIHANSDITDYLKNLIQ